ncbi:MAG: S41 family peptidase [Candidatus Kariarchaeaceae archaeon]|jgi:C-terminal processing protease CtpA/Prc
MIQKKLAIILVTSTLIIIIGLGIFLASFQKPFAIKINSIDPQDLGSEEWLEDFESLYTFIEGNYPFLSVKNRSHGFNWLDLKAHYLDRISKVNNNHEFFAIIADALQALQNRHSWIVNPGQVIQNAEIFENWDPVNQIYSEEVTSSASYWSSIYDQYNSQKYQQKYNLLVVYEKGEYVIFDYNSSWEQQFGDHTIVTHVNGVPIDNAITSTYDRAYIDYDFQRNKLYVQSIYPRHFGENAVFTIKNTTDHVADVSLGLVSDWGGTPYKYPTSLVNTTTFPNKSIAYLYVGSFSGDRVSQYEQQVVNFYHEIEDYDELIIDIRGNNGGFYSIWIDFLVRPFIKDTILHEQYMAYRTDNYVTNVHKNWLTVKMDKNDFSYLPPEVLEDNFDIYKVWQTLTPSEDIQIDFKGKISVLIDNVVYSAAEGFANFCREFDFATIYGTSSAGDGIIVRPLDFVLPNSKLVINIASTLGLDGTGQANEEVKTQPDVYYESSFGNFDELINFVILNRTSQD